MRDDAPERIWVQPDVKGYCITGVWPWKPSEQRNVQEYISADQAQAEKEAAAAAEREACAAEADILEESNMNHAYDIDNPALPFAKAKTARLIAQSIRARAKNDALAALAARAALKENNAPENLQRDRGKFVKPKQGVLCGGYPSDIKENTDPLAARDAQVRADALREASGKVYDVLADLFESQRDTQARGNAAKYLKTATAAILALIPADQEGDG